MDRQSLTRRLILLSAAAMTMSAQSILDPAKIPASLKRFEKQPGEVKMACDVVPLRPWIDFRFRFQAGYVLRVPMRQYAEGGHTFAILARVTPEDADHEPVYLGGAIRLPKMPKTKITLEIGGSYLLGEGHYSVDLALLDDAGRACRKRWTTEARRRPSEHNVSLRIPPGNVWTWASPGLRAHPVDPTGDRPKRVTVFLHAAPIYTRAAQLRAYDREFLLGSLASLIESLQSETVRLVVFNLDQQKKLFNAETFGMKDMDQVSQRMRELQLAVVDYKVLANRGGHLNLLADLVREELRAAEQSDAVIFLGPTSRFFDKFPKPSIEPHEKGGPEFYYLRYERPFFRGGDFPDSIQSLTKGLSGKTFIVHTAGEFASAIRQIQTGLNAHAAKRGD